MHLNLVNLSSIVALAVSTVPCKDVNSRFGAVAKVNDEVFKYTTMGSIKDTLFIKRVDLGELFQDIPQDITELTYTPGSTLGAVNLMEALNFNPLKVDSPLIDEEVVFSETNDPLAHLFTKWVSLVGIGHLPRHEVELSTVDNILYIDASHATVYRGVVSVTF